MLKYASQKVTNASKEEGVLSMSLDTGMGAEMHPTDARPINPHDTVQVLAWQGRALVLVEREGRRGGNCWELSGGSYQLQQGLAPVEAALATLQFETGIVAPSARAKLVYQEYPFNGLPAERNACADAIAYFVEVILPPWPALTCTGARKWRLFSREELVNPAHRLDFWAYAALGYHELRHGGVPKY